MAREVDLWMLCRSVVGRCSCYAVATTAAAAVTLPRPTSTPAMTSGSQAIHVAFVAIGNLQLNACQFTTAGHVTPAS